MIPFYSHRSLNYTISQPLVDYQTTDDPHSQNCYMYLKLNSRDMRTVSKPNYFAFSSHT